jgi:hypothetical protein
VAPPARTHERADHLTAILRDKLGARHIPLVVDSFRDRLIVESGHPTTNGPADRMKQIATNLGIVTIDTWEPLVAAVQRGEQPFTNAGGRTDSHFNPRGHALIAARLHELLPGAIERARASLDDSRRK